MQDILSALGERILILDGAMGTMLQSRGLSGNSEEFNLSDAATVEDIHRAYIEAGADIIETNSTSAPAKFIFEGHTSKFLTAD